MERLTGIEDFLQSICRMDPASGSDSTRDSTFDSIIAILLPFQRFGRGKAFPGGWMPPEEKKEGQR